MRDTLNSIEISTMEDLDPEPGNKGRLAQRRELLLGGVLLAAVLLWAGWQWWHQSAVEQSYRKGQGAALSRDWDGAQAFFAFASGYKDSDARTADATRQIAERDKQYELANSETAAKDWPQSLQAAQAVEQIQPAYRDTAQIKNEAGEQVYGEAVQGVIARRMGQEGTGLYYRTAVGWTDLSGSDAASSIVGSGPAGYTVFDAPAVDKQTEEPSRSGLRYDRRLIAADLTGEKPNFWPLLLPLSSNATYIWGRLGVWMISTDYNDEEVEGPPGVRDSWYDAQVRYQAYRSTTPSTVALPNGDWVFMDFAPDGKHILLADLSLYKGISPVATLYVADADGSRQRLLYTHEGGFQRASFSPDSKYVVLSTYLPAATEPASEEETVILLDVEGIKPSRVLARTVVQIDTTYNRTSVRADFIKHGANTGRLLLITFENGHNFISLLDISSPDMPIIKSEIEGDIGLINYRWAEDTGEGGIAFMWVEGPYIQVVTIYPSKPPTFVYLRDAIQDGRFVEDVAIRDGTIFYSQFKIDGDAVDIYSIPLRQISSADKHATKVYAGTRRATLFHTLFSTHLGTHMYAYIENKTLYAATFDGKTRLKLESNFDSFLEER